MNPNDPAFPESKITEFNSGPALTTMGGLTKREYFAAMAMQGLVHRMSVRFLEEDCAKEALRLADALIEELSK